MEEKTGATNGEIDSTVNPPNLMQGGDLLDKIMNVHELNQEQMSKIKEKYKKDKDFVPPNTNPEKEYALDMIIEQLTEVKNS